MADSDLIVGTHNDLPVINDLHGTPRVLAALPPYSDHGGLPRFATANRIISRDLWKEIDLSPFSVPVMDQGAHGSCVGHGSTTAFWFAYLMAGGTVPPSGFSPTSLYALINGGRDAGAIVSDAMTALMEKGLCLMAEVPETVIYERQIPASAKETRKRFRVQDAFHCNSFDAIGSALMLGFPVSFGITLAGNFNNLDSEGVAGHGRGMIGGHCMAGYGLKRLASGAWAIRVRNSWGVRWGKSGDCLLVEDHFGRGDVDAFAVRASLSDPMDPNKPPVAI